MRTIRFNLKEFEKWLSDMGSLELGVYDLVKSENDIEHTDGMPIGTVYHAYYGTRYEQVKGDIEDRVVDNCNDLFQEGYDQAVSDYEGQLSGRDVHEEMQNR